MAQFSETLWFKVGVEAERELDDDAPPPVVVPLEDRYVDTSTLTVIDIRAFSLETGTTRPCPHIPTPEADDTIHILVADLKRGRRAVFGALGASLMVVVALLVIAL